ncbi:superoxide dismutase[Cu-Zn] [Antrihabitans cavernicola]|uniref:Superoxide dismutase [Cu-Zn] n=1 Tax=Antrihabitans cavernicola TaxID=2495913 RepID=A0A5A7SA29_9NOCA|nr:superoxide dismutase family protein [Spelaeibacter cavernicola]KAA0022139.1 superoxide dismutase family protein [Spelaeibacter cavernicola]
MAPSTARRLSWSVAAPLIAVAALGLTACSNGEEPSSQPGTTPPVWTGSAAPAGQATGEAGSGSEGSEAAGSDSLTAPLKDASGKEIGKVTFTKDGNYVEVKAEAQGLTPGFHGFHVHTAGKCEANSVAPAGGAPGNFLSAGGHLQVAGKTGHPASGDLSSLQVREDGSAELTTTTDAFTLDDLRNNGEGRAVVVHAGPDNFANIPSRYTLPDGAAVPDQETMMTGDAGARVACAVVK